MLDAETKWRSRSEARRTTNEVLEPSAFVASQRTRRFGFGYAIAVISTCLAVVAAVASYDSGDKSLPADHCGVQFFQVNPGSSVTASSVASACSQIVDTRRLEDSVAAVDFFVARGAASVTVTEFSLERLAATLSA